MKEKNYKLSRKKSYYIRWASNIEADLKRNWSSYGYVVFEGKKSDLISRLTEIKDSGGIFDFGFGDTWLDEDTVIKDNDESVTVKTQSDSPYVLRQFNKDEWVVVYNACGLSAHVLKGEDLDTVQDIIDFYEKHKSALDGTGEGTCFDATCSRVIYKGETDLFGRTMYIIEED